MIVLVGSLAQFDCGRMRVDELSTWAYVASFLSVVSLEIRGELKWRKTIG
jgi:hypothetical protein